MLSLCQFTVRNVISVIKVFNKNLSPEKAKSYSLTRLLKFLLLSLRYQKLGWGRLDILVISYGLISDVVGGDQGSCKCQNLSLLNFHNYSI